MIKRNLQREINWPRSLGWVVAELNYPPESLLLADSSLYLRLCQGLSDSSFFHILCVCERERERVREGEEEGMRERNMNL